MMEWNPLDHKAGIRKHITQKRSGLSVEQRERWSEQACVIAGAFLESRAAAVFMVYVPFRSELDLSGLIEWGWHTGRKVVVPRCVAADRSMTLHYLRSWDELVPGAYGIREPNVVMTPPLAEDFVPDVVFVPGLAFDRQGGRLGYGGGYYDRFAERIKQSESKPIWIGAAFEAQLVERVPVEPHDFPMNGIVTERGIYRV
ncbi:5-formyltetrahydrofolate cyclo-ligase [Paenibacillus sp. sgz302251]|uniref:5-formyltetrahydrofolate cyclo-ligase n=1 Tax=Paenibacillus sp. sgz302251 TaxID=3414493 RepID=UPI003C7B18C2